MDLSSARNSRSGIRDDGTFRIYAQEVRVTSRKQQYGSFVWSNVDLQIGTGTNWLAVTGYDEQIVTLKNEAHFGCGIFTSRLQPGQR